MNIHEAYLIFYGRVTGVLESLKEGLLTPEQALERIQQIAAEADKQLEERHV